MAIRVTTEGEIRITGGGAERATSVEDSPTPGVSVLPQLPRRTFRDLRLEVDEEGADLVLEEGDLAGEAGLLTAVLISLFSDARALDKDPFPPEESSRRGWWADEQPDRIGSLLWLLRREKVTRSTVERARQYARSALRWLVDDGIADHVEVEAAVRDTFTVMLTVRLHRGRARRWSEVWAATEAALTTTVKGVEVRILTE